jgi:CheY-like chemotaxis protein
MVKSEHRNKKIFYIEKVVFLRSAIESALKTKGAEIYSVDSLVDNFYLLEDLKPDLILFDVQTVGDSLEQLLSYHHLSVLVATGYQEDESLVAGRVKSFLVKPLVARGLAEQILSLVD